MSIHKNDVGTSFLATIVDQDGDALDVSGAGSKTMYFKKPGGTILTKNADFVNTGSDGRIEYLTVDGDLDEIGIWKIQAFVDVGGIEFYTDTDEFEVLPNLVD